MYCGAVDVGIIDLYFEFGMNTVKIHYYVFYACVCLDQWMTRLHCANIIYYIIYERCYLALVMSFVARVCAAVIGWWSDRLEFLLIQLPDSVASRT